MGTIVNLVALTFLLFFGIKVKWAVALAILIAMTFNFALNRRFSFSFARHRSWIRQYARFVGASSVAAVVNYCLTLVVLNYVPTFPPQAAALIGIIVGTGINFVASRYLVFRATHVRAE
jgi:dolichol-phosphate mannosyltransferase